MAQSTMVMRLARRFISAPVRRAFAGFWVLPLAIASLGLLGALALSLAPRGPVEPLLPGFLLTFDTDGARAALSTVATATMSVVSIVLSLTFVSMSLTAQQLTPRMLDYVLRARVLQTLIGLALATFLFAAVSLIYGGVEGGWRLGLATMLALTLATATMVTVVVFAHIMTTIMRADEMIALRGDALSAALRSKLAGDAWTLSAPWPDESGDDVALFAPFAGYVGEVDLVALTDFAESHDVVVAIDVNSGAFVLAGERLGRLVEVAGEIDGHEAAVALGRVLDMSNRAEAATGVIYEARALAEAAIRALSPGINDPGTAIACLNRLMENLDRWVEAEDAPNARRDKSGRVRVILPEPSAAILIDRALGPLVEHARRDGDVLRAFRRLTGKLLERAGPRDRPAIAALNAELARDG